MFPSEVIVIWRSGQPPRNTPTRPITTPLTIAITTYPAAVRPAGEPGIGERSPLVSAQGKCSNAEGVIRDNTRYAANAPTISAMYPLRSFVCLKRKKSRNPPTEQNRERCAMYPISIPNSIVTIGTATTAMFLGNHPARTMSNPPSLRSSRRSLRLQKPRR